MSIRFENIPNRRAIIDRRMLAEQLQEIGATAKDSAKLRMAAAPLVRDALARGREEISRRLLAAPSRGTPRSACTCPAAAVPDRWQRARAYGRR